MTNERKEYYPKYFVDELENLDDVMSTYTQGTLVGTFLISAKMFLIPCVD